MRKELLLVFFCSSLFFCSVGRTQPKWDQSMQLKSCSIHIRADYFKAKTFIELEFYNPRGTETEGLYSFSLHPGQAITAFQLDLNGKYRDGSIEEKWKATNAYNTIVGKRIDPALLRMESPNNYTLRIYPVPAKGSRKVTITIEQLLKKQDAFVVYSLPLKNSDSVSNFNLRIDVEHTTEKPRTGIGFIRHLDFSNGAQGFFLDWMTKNLLLNNGIQFQIPLPSVSPIVCTEKQNGDLFWAIKLGKSQEEQYQAKPKRIAVYWDVSFSGAKRNIRREMRFLEQYISYYDIEQVTIFTFNHERQDSIVFYPLRGYNSNWQQYIRKLQYDGATQFGCLDFNVNADQILLFTDGHNSFGKALPDKGAVPVHAIFDATSPNKKMLEAIIEGSGGQLIDLNQLDPWKAINLAGKLDCYLMGITATKGKLISHQYFPINLQSIGQLSGSVTGSEDTLVFHFGNNSGIRRIEKIPVSQNQECKSAGLERIPMLCVFQSKITQDDWANTFEFGMIEKVVTPYTAYIVLERVEDYIKYNITPPAELEEECRQLNFVKKDFRKQLEEFKVENQWNAVIGEFNQSIKWWNASASLIPLNQSFQFGSSFLTNSSMGLITSPSAPNLSDAAVGAYLGSGKKNLDEVVVVGYGVSLRREVAYSITTIRQNQLYSGVSLENQLAGRVAGLQVTDKTIPGGSSSIRIRGSSSIYGSRSNSQPLYVMDGIVIEPGNNLNWINPNDIETITILKDAAAGAIYGSRAANGVIVITTKKGRRSPQYYRGKYRLKDQEDEDYIKEIQSIPPGLKLVKYDELRVEYGHTTAFYFDMADHFFSIGNSKKAVSILLNTAEITSGNLTVLRSIGHFFEKWKMWESAVSVYKNLAAITGGIDCYRDLGWAYYQSGNFQEAIKTLYAAILLDTKDAEAKSNLLNEINAIIAAHKDVLDISFIPSSLITALPVDLRILVDGDRQSFSMQITEAKGNIRNAKSNESSGNSRLRHIYTRRGNLFEYQIKKAQQGTYRVAINYYDYGSKPFDAPAFFRIISFSNFGKPGQKISIEMVNLDNQFGEIEVATIVWPENNK